MSAEPLKVVLCWHMHQPVYRDALDNEYRLPWTYLHAMKDYVDMAAHLEANPGARAVVNFVPVLLEQIADYQQQIEDFLEGEGAIRDPLLAALVNPVLPTDLDHRHTLMKACLRLNRARCVDRYEPFAKLASVADAAENDGHTLTWLNGQYFADLLVWYHLAWLGESVRRTDLAVKALIKKGQGFSMQDRRTLLRVIGRLMDTLCSRYAHLAKEGRVELAMTPYAHPIMPLMLEIDSAREAWPEAQLPSMDDYPGGDERSRWHVSHGLEVFEQFFGHRPVGCWPAEGSVSDATLDLLQDSGFEWAASGQAVLSNSLQSTGIGHTAGWAHQPWRAGDKGMTCFFRDDGLSDLIGFTYSDWHADDAVANLISHLETLAAEPDMPAGRVVSIIMDGENAWEFYPENGHFFLNALYARLAEHPGLELTTFGDIVADKPTVPVLPSVTAGSWVYGTFSTWIGDPDKNRGWEMLAEAKRAFDRAVASGELSERRRLRAERQLAVCEGSDWFWWFGDYNPSDTVADFEHLYRRHLTSLYQILGMDPPDYLSVAFTHGGGDPENGGMMRKTS